MGDLIHLDAYRPDRLEVTVGSDGELVIVMFQSPEDVAESEAYVVGLSVDRAELLARSLLEVAESLSSSRQPDLCGPTENEP